MKRECKGLHWQSIWKRVWTCLPLVLILSGCATTDITKQKDDKSDLRGFQKSESNIAAVTDARTDADSGKTYDEERITLEGIGVQEIEGGKKVVILGSKPMSYTAFKLSDPSRLVIDIPNIDFGDLQSPLIVESSVIKTIDTHIFGEDTGNIGRIEIEMQGGVDYELDSIGSSIYAKFVKAEDGVINAVESPSSAKEGSTDKDGYKTVQPVTAEFRKEADENEMVAVAKSDITEDARGEMRDLSTGNSTEGKLRPPDDEVAIQKVEKELKNLKVAERLLAIDVKKTDDTTEILLKSDGIITSFDSFRMSNTERILIDLWGIKNKLAIRDLPIETPFADRIRTGIHSDKTRVVIDLKSKDTAYSVEQVDEGLLLALMQKGDKDDRRAASLSGNQQGLKKVMNTDSHDKGTSVVQITNVSFEDNEAASNVLVRSLNKVNYDFSKSYDGKTLALIVEDAFLPDHLQRTLDTSMLKGPAERVSSFMSAGKTDNKAMIVVKLREKVPYKITQEEQLLTLSFPKQHVENHQDSKDTRLAATGEITDDKEKILNSGPTRMTESISSEKNGLKEKHKMAAVQAGSRYVSSTSMGQEKAIVNKQNNVVKTISKKTYKKKYVGRKISLDFKDADIKNILRLIAEVSNLNIVAGDDVKGKVTLRLLNVPWDQALELVLKSKNLGMVKEGNVIRIAPLTKIAAEKKLLLDDKESEEKLEDLAVKLVPVNYSNADDLMDKIKSLLSDRGSVTVDRRTNVMIIKDIKENIEAAESLVKHLDSPTPQVLIEARIVEAQRNFARDLGVEWGAAALSGNPVFGSIFGNSNTSPSNTLLPPGMVGGGGQFSTQPNFGVSLPASGTAGSLGSVGFSFGKLTGDPWLIDLRLSAGEVSGLSKTISRPRVITLDHTEAKISQGDSVPFETVSDGGTNTEFIDATLDLTVTPHITPDGSVFMKVKVSRNSIGTFRSASGTPSISKKEASSEIMVRDGETVVIGGIVVSDESDSKSGVPYLKNISGLGWLFKRNSIADTQTELLIFITPTIVKEKRVG
jgi:type IV pilus assembly protein PilQ